MADHTHHHDHDHDHDDDHDHGDDELRRAAFSQIRQYGDPVLRTPTLEVTRFDRELRDEATRMIELMDAAGGVGLAAPQIGLLSRIAVMRLDDDNVTVLCNPRITWRSDDVEDGTEGCLSIGRAGIAVNVERSVAVRVEAQGVDGASITLEPRGYDARVVQHEIDHLDGVLMLDRTNAEDRRQALRELRRADH